MMQNRVHCRIAAEKAFSRRESAQIVLPALAISDGMWYYDNTAYRDSEKA